MNNTNSNVIQDIVKKIPITLFFSTLPDRQSALKYINWLYDNIPQSKTVVQDNLFREVISKHLRIVSMKIIEIEILFIVALKTITLEDFTLDHSSLIKKVISENPDENDLDLMYRILAQIMTKLPTDLRDKVTGEHKLQIFQLIASFINMEPKLLERFMAFDPSLNTPISMTLDSGDYNTLNKKYLEELAKFQASQPYVDSNSMEFASIANNMLNTMPTTGSNNNIDGQYIDSSPDLMVGVQDNKLYYFDSSSGTISEFPISGQTQTPVSINDLTNVLLSNKVDKNQISSLISSLQSQNNPNNIPTTTHPISYLNSLFQKFDLSRIFKSSNETTITCQPIPPVQAIPPIPPQFILSQYSPNPNQMAAMPNQMSAMPPMPPNPNQMPPIPNQIPPNPSITPNPNLMQSNPNQILRNPYFNPYYNPDYNYNPNDFIYPNINLVPQQTSNFLTRNDACSLPNPPASCPKKTDPNVTIPNDNILEARYKLRDSTYFRNPQQVSHFSNMNSNNDEAEFIKKITKNNKDIENVAIAFVTIIILLFVLVIFNSIRNKTGLAKTK
jgi:hypothetical protein